MLHVRYQRDIISYHHHQLVQFARINVVLSASTSGPRPHETVINVIHAVVAETEKFLEVAGTKRERTFTKLIHWHITVKIMEMC